MNHSPLPWAERELPETLKPDGYRRIVDKDGRHVATVPYSTPTTPDAIDGHANLEYLLLAANTFGPIRELMHHVIRVADTLCGPDKTPAGYVGPPEYNPLPIRELNLSARSRKCLIRLGINTLGELLNYSADDLLECKNFGILSLTEIRENLAGRNFYLRPSITDTLPVKLGGCLSGKTLDSVEEPPADTPPE